MASLSQPGQSRGLRQAAAADALRPPACADGLQVPASDPLTADPLTHSGEPCRKAAPQIRWPAPPGDRSAQACRRAVPHRGP